MEGPKKLPKPPPWVSSTRRKLQGAARTLSIASFLFFLVGTLGLFVGLGVGIPELGLLLILGPLCLVLAFGAAIGTTVVAVFARYTLGGMMKVVLSGASCMTAIASGNSVFIVLGVIGMIVWALVMLILISKKENQWDWEEDKI